MTVQIHLPALSALYIHRLSLHFQLYHPNLSLHFQLTIPVAVSPVLQIIDLLPLSGWFLLIFGILFILRAGIEYMGANLNQEILAPPDVSVLIADIFISILWIAGGLLLLRNAPLGYTAGLGLLFAASTLFVGLIIFLLVQPAITSASFSLVDLIVVSIMGLILSIPFIVFLRGSIKAS